MKSVYTKIPYYEHHPDWNEMHDWMTQNVGQHNRDWHTYPWGLNTEITVRDKVAPLVALRWA